jgi:hypothetical protein
MSETRNLDIQRGQEGIEEREVILMSGGGGCYHTQSKCPEKKWRKEFACNKQINIIEGTEYKRITTFMACILLCVTYK